MDSWVVYALAAFFAFGMANFLMKFVSGKIPAALLSVIYIGMAFATVFAIFIFNRTLSFQLQVSNIILFASLAGIILGIGIFSALTALGLGLGSKVVTVFNMNTLLTVVLLVLLMGEKLTPKVTLGIAFAVLSLYLLTT